MTFRIIAFIIIMITGSSQYILAESISQKRAFQVEDSIEMVRIVNPNVALSAFYPPKIKISPDGKYFILVTRRGNPATNKNVYNLLLYRTDQILAYLKKPASDQALLPKGQTLLQISTSRNEMAFQKITWFGNSNAISFIGWFDPDKNSAPGQVYNYDLISGEMQKLTNHPRPITDFAFNISSQKIIFASTIARNNKDRTKSSYLAGVRNINSIINPDWEYPEPAVQYFVQDINSPEKAQAVGNIYHGFFPTKIWLSPDGQKAIILTTQKSVPKHWLEGFDFLKDDFNKRALADFDENTMLPREDLTTSFNIIDITTGNIRPVFNAPTGLWKGGSTVDAIWLPDSRSVILANTALPLNYVDEANRRHNFFTVEYDVNSGTVTPITEHLSKTLSIKSGIKVRGKITRGQFYSMNITPEGLLKIRQKHWRNHLPDSFFIKKHGTWRKTTPSSGLEKTDNNHRLVLSIYQGLNSPPELMAEDKMTGSKKIISDFNPQFRNLTFGTVEIINWKAPDGRDWRGGLVYPPNYKKGQKYPLVIQTHGFDPHKFLIDGPYGTASAFAAQALANKNIMVLQMAEPSVSQSQDELITYRSGFESAIDYLAGLNLIDRHNVGLIGWSSTGVDVQHMLIHSDYPIKAATIADSYNFGMFGYINQFGARAPGMAHMETMIGNRVPWGKDLKKWVANNPTLHLDRIKTPLRYEQYETGLSSWWENYAILKRQQKPVEYYVFNDAAHALIKPEHRKTSQQGTVDWFTFWLKGEEDPDPAKADQYQRWRKLRVQQILSEATANDIGT